ETEPLLGFAHVAAAEAATRVFWYRWYVLLVYCLLVTQQGAVWSHWGPISDSVQAAYNWSNATISLLSFWGPITYVACFYPWTLFMRRRSLRSACVVSAAFVALGCVLKAMPVHSDSIFAAMCHACGILNGFAGPVVTAAGTKLAAEWFPMNERVTAVAIATMSQSLGPTLIIRNQVALYNYADLGVSCLILLLILLYFPSRPKLPPSVSSQLERSPDKGLLHLGLNTWLAVLAFGMPNGVTNSYSAVFDLNMLAYKVRQEKSDWIGFASSAASMGLILLAGRLVDCFRRPRMAALSTGLLIMSTVSFVWFTLICELPGLRTTLGLYLGNVLGIAAQTATTPLFFEMACESAFPVGEETTTMVVTACSNVFSALFLTALFFPQMGTRWMNYASTGSCLLAVPLVLRFREVYRRREYDLLATESSGASVQA
uniref:MFS domain-containing protein n=1 Tax=Macrostomum lignano TaxID=282301 RepID=A0A1I8GTS8_9PLAT